jgi:prophage tail gpP-like protein
MIKVLINSSEFYGWESISIKRSIEAISGAFTMQVSDRWQDGQKSFDIFPGDTCQLIEDGITLINGHVDDVPISQDADSVSISVTGRDRSADLVDCSAENKPGEWRKAKLETIIADICKPFGIYVKAEIDTGEKFDPAFSLEPGERAFEAIDRACRMRGVLPVSDGDGNIILTKPGVREADDFLAVGDGVVEKVSATYSHKERFSSYTVKGTAKPTDDFFGKTAYQITGSASDPTVSRYRPLIIISETPCTRKIAEHRAAWEASIRAGRAASIAVDVTGWYQSTGRLWQINELVAITAPRVRLNGDRLLIAEITYTINDGSNRMTSLTLRRPEAYQPEWWKTKKAKVTTDSWAAVRNAVQK